LRTLLVCLPLAAGAAQADDNLFYLGAGVSHDRVGNFILQANPENTRGFPDISARSWKAFIAVRPTHYVAVEADYLDLGGSTQRLNPGYFDRAEGKARAVFAVGILPFGGLQSVDCFAKVGVSRWDLTARFGAPVLSAFSESDNGNSVAWGLGLLGHVGHFGARLEYENWNMGLTNGARVLSLAAVVML
jgi:hypothetical protein